MSDDREIQTPPAHGDDCGCGRSRRNVLSMAGVGVIGAGLLAACGTSSDAAAPGATSAAPTSAAPTSAAPTSAAPTSAAPTSAAPTSAAPTSAAPTSAAPTSAAPTSAAPTSAAPAPAGFTVATSDIPVGGGKIFEDEKLVVTQPTAGQFKAFSAVCPHQGCNVASISTTKKQIVCPCHSSYFDLATGERISGPAQTGLSTEKVTVSGANVTVAT